MINYSKFSFENSGVISMARVTKSASKKVATELEKEIVDAFAIKKARKGDFCDFMLNARMEFE